MGLGVRVEVWQGGSLLFVDSLAEAHAVLMPPRCDRGVGRNTLQQSCSPPPPPQPPLCEPKSQTLNL